jgi:hypothetical protein
MQAALYLVFGFVPEFVEDGVSQKSVVGYLFSSTFPTIVVQMATQLTPFKIATHY